ncbi:MAG TPA: CPBP family intramembrane glutamic endopeptidase [Chitinophagaceae bacterium]
MERVNKGRATLYFVLCFGISWTAAFLLVASRLCRGEHLQKFDGILMFPLMLLGPPLAGITLTLIEDGRAGWKNLLSRLSFRGWTNRSWLFLLLIPPVLIGMVLFTFSKLSGAVYSPNFFAAGFIFGLMAGFLEEIGWMGFVFPELRYKYSFLSTSLLLGFLWGCWHLPVMDFLGAATPHSHWLPGFFIVFVFVMMAVRILICMLYSKTGSIIPAMLLHASSTGYLATLSPPRVSASQEVCWYFAYGILLWISVFLIYKYQFPSTKQQESKMSVKN